jgi:hypothetical protein
MHRIAPLLALAVLTAFLAVLLIAVPRWDLGAVIVLTVVLAARDFAGTILGRK